MTRAIILAAFLAFSAYADGPSSIPGDQCDEAFVPLEYPEAPADTVQAWNEVGLKAWQEACEPRLTMFTDEEKLAFLLSGHYVPPAPVPLMPAAPYLLVALAALYFWRKG